ncbi:hypothetical protein KCP76_00515 [Salmonella enterica subsp. enterica serovar Weltevreden]|nr:hypothetical protein KCP76_00515 [Salmonella enterica subsp. enterica serovar Weltevreden]
MAACALLCSTKRFLILAHRHSDERGAQETAKSGAVWCGHIARPTEPVTRGRRPLNILIQRPR